MRCRGALGVVLSSCLLLFVACGDDGATNPAPTTDDDPATTEPATPTPADTPTTGTATSGTGPTDPGSPTTGAVPGSTDVPAPTVAPADVRVALEPVVTVDQPVAFAVRPGDPALYVVAQGGQILAVRDGQVVAPPVLDISDEIQSGGEQGLLGLAFSPDGTKAYIHATQPSGDGQIDEYAVGVDGTFDPTSQRTLLTVDHRDYPNHNGGSVVTGPDGLLYLGFGDGGGGGDPLRAGQDLSTLLGKILRIDPVPSGDQPYSIPGDNPFVGVGGARPEIWSYGLRNPWRFSFDRGTGDLWVGDVGQGDVEEIDWVTAELGAGAGANFGWSAYEGTERYHDDQSADDHTPPVHQYRHDDGNVSVTGGHVYRGSAIPGLVGAYVFGDYGSGRIWALRPNDEGDPDVAEIARQGGLASFGEDAAGELYVLSIADNTVYRIIPG